MKTDGTFKTKIIKKYILHSAYTTHKNIVYNKMAKGIIHWLVFFSNLAIWSGPGNETVIFPIFQICGVSLEPLIRATIRLRLGIEKGSTFLWNRLSRYSRQSSGYMFVRKLFSYCPLFQTLILNDS